MVCIPVVRCSLVRDGSQCVEERPTASHPALVGTLLAKYLEGCDREHFVALLLDRKNRIVAINTVSIGTLDSALVHPREVFKPAILSGAGSIILGHNHPSGDPAPSAEDLRVTQRMVEAGNLLGIDVLDHVIVGEEDRYYSMKEGGHL